MNPALVRGERPGLTPWEQALRAASVLLALISITFAVKYAVDSVSRNSEFPFAANSIAKDALLLAACWLVYWDVRRWGAVAVPIIVLGHVVLIAGILLTWLWGNNKSIQFSWISPPSSASGLRTRPRSFAR